MVIHKCSVGVMSYVVMLLRDYIYHQYNKIIHTVLMSPYFPMQILSYIQVIHRYIVNVIHRHACIIPHISSFRLECDILKLKHTYIHRHDQSKVLLWIYAKKPFFPLCISRTTHASVNVYSS